MFYQVPRSTLRDALRDPDRNKPGRPKALTKEEEDELRTYTKWMAEKGHGLSTKMLVQLATLIRQEKFKDAKELCNEWGRVFIKRNNLSIRYA